MTPEERARQCLERHADHGLNDSMWLPIDLEQRIAEAIREAKREAYEEAARIADAKHKFAFDLALEGLGSDYEDIAKDIRELKYPLVEKETSSL